MKLGVALISGVKQRGGVLSLRYYGGSYPVLADKDKIVPVNHLRLVNIANDGFNVAS